MNSLIAKMRKSFEDEANVFDHVSTEADFIVWVNSLSNYELSQEISRMLQVPTV